jgi:hypothetical protein
MLWNTGEIKINKFPSARRVLTNACLLSCLVYAALGAGSVLAWIPPPPVPSPEPVIPEVDPLPSENGEDYFSKTYEDEAIFTSNSGSEITIKSYCEASFKVHWYLGPETFWNHRYDLDSDSIKFKLNCNITSSEPLNTYGVDSSTLTHIVNFEYTPLDEVGVHIDAFYRSDRFNALFEFEVVCRESENWDCGNQYYADERGFNEKIAENEEMLERYELAGAASAIALNFGPIGWAIAATIQVLQYTFGLSDVKDAVQEAFPKEAEKQAEIFARKNNLIVLAALIGRAEEERRLTRTLSVITNFLLADDDETDESNDSNNKNDSNSDNSQPQLLAQWQDTQSSLPQALVSTNPEDYTEDQYACHAYLIKTDSNTYNLAFTTQKGAVEIRIEPQQRTREVQKTRQVQKTREVQKTRTVYAPAWWWFFGMGWISWQETYTAQEPYTDTETYWDTETYTEDVEVQTVVSQDCDQRAEVDTFINALSIGSSHTFTLNGTTSLTGSIMVDDHRRDPLGYRIVEVTSNNPITINSQPVEISTLDDNPSNERWVRLDSVSVY